MKAMVCTGGGIRGIAVAGILSAGIACNKWAPKSFDVFTGDSFGALAAALCANNWTVSHMRNFFIEMPIVELFTSLPWFIRKPMIPLHPISLEATKHYIDTMDLKPSNRLFVNSWNCKENVQYIFCEKKPAWARASCFDVVWVENAFSELGYGTVLTRSMALPGLVADSPEWMDGGVGEHPPLSFLPLDAQILMINLGYSGKYPMKKDGIPQGLLARGMYAYEVTAFIRTMCDKAPYANLTELNPKIYDIDSMAVDLNESQRVDVMNRAYLATTSQWDAWSL